MSELRSTPVRKVLFTDEFIQDPNLLAFTPFYPGPGLGGHCIPVDPFYLSWKAKEWDFRTRFIELAGEINTNMPDHVLASIGGALNQQKKSVNGARVLILGVAYKKDIDDLRESPPSPLSNYC